MNPYKDVMGRTLRKTLVNKMQTFLIDWETINTWKEDMYYEAEYLPAERTKHNDLTSCSQRLKNYRHKKIDNYDKIVK